MTNLPPSRTADKIIVRLPDGMRDKLRARADANHRSVTAEVVSILALAVGESEAQDINALRVKLSMVNDQMRAAAQQIDAIAQNKRLIEQEIAVREAMLAEKQRDESIFQRLAKLAKDDAEPVEGKVKKG